MQIDSESTLHLARDADSERRIRRVTWTGLIINLLLSAFKIFAGIVGSSQVIIADAVHSLSDTTTDVAILVGSQYWSRPPDEGHQHGHRRIETMVILIIGSILVLAAIGISWEAIDSLREDQTSQPTWIALAAAAISIIVKETLFRWTAFVGRSVKSSALIANAWHHRLDAMSSVPALLAVGGAILFPSWLFLDRVGAIVVSLFILQAAFRIIWPGIRELLDAGAPKHICQQIENIVMKEEAIQQVHSMRTRYIGTNLQVDLHVVVDGSLTVLAGHDIAEAVRNRLLAEGPDIIDVLVHIEPSEAALPGNH